MVLNIYHFMAFIAIFVIIYLIVRLYNKNAIKKDNILGERLSEILLIAISLAFGVIFIPVVYLVTIDEIHITKGDVYIKNLKVEQVFLKNKDLTIKNSNDYKIKLFYEDGSLDNVYVKIVNKEEDIEDFEVSY